MVSSRQKGKEKEHCKGEKGSKLTRLLKNDRLLLGAKQRDYRKVDLFGIPFDKKKAIKLGKENRCSSIKHFSQLPATLKSPFPVSHNCFSLWMLIWVLSTLSRKVDSLRTQFEHHTGKTIGCIFFSNIPHRHLLFARLIFSTSVFSFQNKLNISIAPCFGGPMFLCFVIELFAWFLLFHLFRAISS